MWRLAADPPFDPVPQVPPVPPGVDRPLFSVMIPTYRSGELLEQTLRGVLDQDPGPDRMQIAVVDDHSPDDHHLRVVRRLAPRRVEVHAQPANVGLARNWNGAVARSRGRWVHLLHQDDLVLPGFYDRLARADAAADGVGAAFCRHHFIDAQGRRAELSGLERAEAGVLDGWLARIARSQRIQCPSIVVRRDTYEQLGGFRTDLRYALDWEMWVRIAARRPVWYEPEPLACYRIHDGNETARLRRANRDLPDILRAIRILAGVVPADVRPDLGRDLLTWLRDRELAAMILQFSERRVGTGLNHLLRARGCDPSGDFAALFLRRYARWALKVLLLGPRPARRRLEEPIG